MYVWSWQFMGIISLNEACSFRHGTGMCSRHSISVDKFINSSLRTWKSYLKIAPTKTRLLSWKKFEMRLPWQARSTNHAKLEPFTAVKEKLFQLWSQVSFFEISHSFRDLFFFAPRKHFLQYELPTWCIWEISKMSGHVCLHQNNMGT